MPGVPLLTPGSSLVMAPGRCVSPPIKQRRHPLPPSLSEGPSAYTVKLIQLTDTHRALSHWAPAPVPPPTPNPSPCAAARKPGPPSSPRALSLFPPTAQGLSLHGLRPPCAAPSCSLASPHNPLLPSQDRAPTAHPRRSLPRLLRTITGIHPQRLGALCLNSYNNQSPANLSLIYPRPTLLLAQEQLKAKLMVDS